MVSSDYLPAIGGVANHVFNVSKALRELGIDVTVAQPYPSTGTTALEKVPTADVPVLRLPWSPSTSKPLDMLARLRAGRRLRGEVEFEIVHQHDYRTSVLVAQMLRRHAGFVFTNHTSDAVRKSASRVSRTVDRIAWAGVDHVIAPSAELASLSQRVFRAPVSQIPNGVDLRQFPPRPDEPSTSVFTVLCPRRVQRKNGIIHLVRAMHELPKPRRHDTWHVVFTGTDPAPNTDAAYLADVESALVGLPDHVSFSFAGNLTIPQMARAYRTANVVVIPSLVEAISLSALEAMATCVPVVASDVGGLSELIDSGRTGVLVPAGQPSMIVRALCELEDAKGLRTKLSSAALEEVRSSYTWESVARATLAVYESVLA
jgi:glycosyltransferase involved in cell wall biosynthesis